MKKLFCTIFLSLALLTGCSNSAPADDATGNTNDTEVNATEYESTSDTNESESTSELLDGMAYQFEDGAYVTIDELLCPMNTLNNICQGVCDSTAFSKVYPDDVLMKLIEYNAFDSAETYADFLLTTYTQMYGSDFSLSNEYISCSLLTDEQLSDMTAFYEEYFFTEINADYAFIVESKFCVTYTDEDGNEQGDYSSDYYIAYSLNGCIFLDYFYVDSLDL